MPDRIPALTLLRDASSRSPTAAVRLLLLLVFALLVAWRMPEILLKGRFWAEEGSVFLPLAWSRPWPRALFSTYNGYLNISANIAALLAWHAAPLRVAPYVTSGVALCFQLCPAILLLTSRLAWLDRWPVLVAALLIVLGVPASQEIWLSSICSQMILALCAALVLALEPRGGRLGVFRLGLLGLAALSGPGAWALLPLFGLRAWLERSPVRAAQAGVLAAGVLVQLVFFYSRIDGRSYAIQPLIYAALAFYKHATLPLLGPDMAQQIGLGVEQGLKAGMAPWRFAIGGLGAALALAGAAAMCQRKEAAWLLAAAGLLIVISYFGAIGQLSGLFLPAAGGRYSYGPQVLIGLAVLCMATQAGFIGWAATCLCSWLIATSMVYYFISINPAFSAGPAFAKELRLHERDPSHVIRSWPPGWVVRLPGRP